MTEKIEIQGKTVNEAVSEALLKMGARRDEVDVTVLEEPKSGFLGILGGRPARVVVRKRRGGGGRRDYRKNENGHKPHSLDGGRGGRGRGGQRRASPAHQTVSSYAPLHEAPISGASPPCS